MKRQKMADRSQVASTWMAWFKKVGAGGQVCLNDENHRVFQGMKMMKENDGEDGKREVCAKAGGK